MKFPIYFSKKIAFSKDNKNNLSRIIIFIGRLSVALGIVVSLITISTGLGSKKAIKNKMGDFSGHISIKSTKSNASYNSSVLDQENFDIKELKKIPEVETAQSYASLSGILRTKENFAGIILKGVGKDFDKNRFQKFIISGEIPDYTEKGYNNDIMLSDTNISVILGIMLVVVVINIIMVLLILIIERTNSIGVLKTLGANNNQIRAIFINYTLLIIIPGLIVGNLIGIGLLLIQKYFGIIKLNPREYYISTVPVDLNLGYILALSLGILVVSAISLIVPSYLISRISPAKVVKYN